MQTQTQSPVSSRMRRAAGHAATGSGSDTKPVPLRRNRHPTASAVRRRSTEPESDRESKSGTPGGKGLPVRISLLENSIVHGFRSGANTETF